jgi:hypothetical protein
VLMIEGSEGSRWTERIGLKLACLSRPNWPPGRADAHPMTVKQARVVIVLLLTLLRSQRTNRNRTNQREPGINNCFLESALNELYRSNACE